MTIWDFANEHWFIALLMVWAVAGTLRLPFYIWGRGIRHKTLRQHGWPPRGIDADGQFKEDKK